MNRETVAAREWLWREDALRMEAMDAADAADLGRKAESWKNSILQGIANGDTDGVLAYQDTLVGLLVIGSLDRVDWGGVYASLH